MEGLKGEKKPEVLHVITMNGFQNACFPTCNRKKMVEPTYRQEGVCTEALYIHLHLSNGSFSPCVLCSDSIVPTLIRLLNTVSPVWFGLYGVENIRLNNFKPYLPAFIDV